jgi:class 3 adenylate cyclase
VSYSPDPLHTAHIRLPRELMELREILAENVHDMWAGQRIVEGWVYGPERDDQSRTHPCLVRYDQLPESEKEYDRETAVETLRAVLALGYRILPPSGAAQPVAKSSQVEHALGGLRELLDAPGPSDLRSLITRWRATAADCRWNDVELSRRFIERLLEFHEPLLAFDCVCEGLTRWPDDSRLRQLKGMSLARSGAVRQANQIFRQLRAEGHSDEETLANLARTYKTLWCEARDEREQRTHLDAAYNAYVESYETTKGYWSGINVAFLALMRGDRSHACEIAMRVYEQCARELDATRLAGHDAYWLTATLGEAALIRGALEEAVQWYTRATAIAGRRYGSVASTCRQARALVAHLNLDWPRFTGCFPLPEVVVFCSAPCGASPASWEASESQPVELAQTLCARVTSERPVLGFSRLRSWPDLVFLETVLQMSGDVAVLLDSEADRDDARDRDFTERARQVLAKCSEIHYLTARAGAPAAPSRDYARKVLIGLGNMQARQLGTVPVVLTLPHEESSEQAARSDPTPAGIPGTPPRVMALLFADVQGFSRLHEVQLIAFSREFLGTVSALIRSSEAPPVTRHTWGDGLFFTFERIVDAGTFALSLAELIDSTDWRRLGLPEDLSIRIGLHAGPVYECFDPVSGQKTFCGIHVNHAARIEPIAPPGHVYASEAFAALASEENVNSFVCEYVGRTPLAKDFGMFSTYHVRRGAPEHS